MKLTNILMLLFLLSAFAIGSGLQDSDSDFIDSAVDNATLKIENISLDFPSNTNLPNAKGLFKVIESEVHFTGIAGMEVMRTGVHFGKDNPDYFNPEFIIKIVKLICILAIISLLIRPAFYLIIFIGMGVIWLINKKKEKDALVNNGEKK